MITITSTFVSPLDEKNRYTVWNAFSDGSASSTEVTRHTEHLGSAKVTWKENHAAGSYMAEMIQKMGQLQ